MEDSIIVKEIASGDYSHFDELYRRHYKKFYDLAFRITKCDFVAEDVVQEAFAIAGLKLKFFKGTCTFTSWFYRVVTNCAFMHLRSQKKFARLREAMSTDDSWVYHPSTFDAAYISSLIEKALIDLDPKYAEAFRKVVLEELSVRVAAQEVGIDISCLKSRVFRAKRYLERRIKRELKSQDIPVNELICNSR